MKLVFKINTDDFELDCGYGFEIEGQNYITLKEKAIQFLENITLTWVKTWKVTTNDKVVEGDYSHTWYNLRDEAIDYLLNDEFDFSYGGNQTIKCYFIADTISQTGTIEPDYYQDCQYLEQKVKELQTKLDDERNDWEVIVSTNLQHITELKSVLKEVLNDWNNEYRITETQSYNKAKKLLGEI